MNNGKRKYRLAILLLSLFYINFFVFIPYFHHHHSTTTKFHENGEIVLSLFPSACCEDVCENAFKNNANLDVEHSHKDEICSKNEITSTWDNQLNLKVNKSAQIDYNIFSDNLSINTQFADQSIHLITWQKFVHKAANTSPPIS